MRSEPGAGSSPPRVHSISFVFGKQLIVGVVVAFMHFSSGLGSPPVTLFMDLVFSFSNINFFIESSVTMVFFGGKLLRCGLAVGLKAGSGVRFFFAQCTFDII